MRVRGGAWGLGIVVAAVLAGTGAAQASAGCTAVNNGAFDGNHSGGSSGSSSSTSSSSGGSSGPLISTSIAGNQFEIGDTLHVAVSIGSENGIAQLIYDATAYVSYHDGGSFSDTIVLDVDNTGNDSWHSSVEGFEDSYASITVTCTPATVEPEPEPEENDDSAALDEIAVNVGGQSAEASAGMMGGLVRSGFAATNGDGTAVLTELDVGQASAAMRVDFATLWAGLKARTIMPNASGWLGGQAMGAAGINFELNDGFVAGVFVTAEAGSYADDAAGHSLDVRGAGIGADAMLSLTEGWHIEALVSYSALAYSLDANGVTGAFGAQRLIADVSVNGSVEIGEGVTFEPRAGVFVLREVQAAYTDSAAVDHDEAVLGSYRAEAGGRLVLAVPQMAGVHVHAGGYGRYSSAGGASAALSAGVSADLGTTALGLEFNLDNIGSAQPMGYGVTAKLAAEF